MDDAKIVEALAALKTTSGRRTKMGILRALLPQIEAAQLAGVPHEEIWQTLKQHGLDVSAKTYSVLLARARAQVRAGAATGGTPTSESPPAVPDNPKAQPAPSEKPAENFQAADSDPFGVIPDKDAVSKKFTTYQSSNSLLNRKKTGES